MFEAPGGRSVWVRGTARYLRDRGALRRLVRPSLTKYYFHPRALWLAVRNLPRLGAMLRYYRERTDAGVIEVTPESITIAPAPAGSSPRATQF